jgi:small subunit ribosomal protein S17e
MDRIKRLSYEVLDGHKSKFGEDFAGNKKALDQISIIRSKGLKNEIAGFITKFIKKEIREEKAKQARIDASKAEQQAAEQSQKELVENTATKEETDTTEEISTVETTESSTEEISTVETTE